MNRGRLSSKMSLFDLVKQLHRFEPQASVTRGVESGKVKWIVKWPRKEPGLMHRVAHRSQKEAIIRATSKLMNAARTSEKTNAVR